MSNMYNVTASLLMFGCQRELKDCWINHWGKINTFSISPSCLFLMILHHLVSVLDVLPRSKDPRQTNYLRKKNKLIISYYFRIALTSLITWSQLLVLFALMVPELGYYTASGLVTAEISERKASHWTAVTTPAVSGLCSQLPFIQCTSRSDSSQASLWTARSQPVVHGDFSFHESQLQVLCTSVTLTHQQILAYLFWAAVSSCVLLNLLVILTQLHCSQKSLLE